MTKEELAEVRAAVLEALVDYEGFKRNRRNQAVKKVVRGTIAATALGSAGFSLAQSERGTRHSLEENRPAIVDTSSVADKSDAATYRYEQTVRGAVHFGFGSRSLALAHMERLDLLVDQLPAGAELTIVGHTDSRGNKAYNYKLGKQRALAVARYLAEKGVTVKMVGSKGETSESNGWMARRVDIKLVYTAPEAVIVSLPPMLEPFGQGHSAKSATVDASDAPVPAPVEPMQRAAEEAAPAVKPAEEKAEPLAAPVKYESPATPPTAPHRAQSVVGRDKLTEALTAAAAQPPRHPVEQASAAPAQSESRSWTRMVFDDRWRVSEARLARMRPVTGTEDAPRGAGAGDNE